MYRLYFKRGIDITLSGLAIVILSPIMVICSIIIFLQDRNNVIFRQKRIGKNGKEFDFYKFRSMPVNTPNVESHKTQQLVITPFGKIIRRTNLDELPQLWNILIGDMSIVGPRPPIPSQTELIELRRANGSLSIQPGLTGWAQVNSYDYMPFSHKAQLDGEYADKLSFPMDLKIIFRTFIYLTKKPPTY